MNRTIRALACASALLFTLSIESPALAAASDGVPEVLRPWIDWTLHDVSDARCPRLDGGERNCGFASSMSLSIEESGASFRIRASAFRDGVPLELPGQAGSWPQNVRVDGTAAAVVAQDGKPRILLAAGAHRIEGRLAWQRAPAQIALPAQYAQISVSLRGREVRPDDEGIVWLSRPSAAPAEQDSMTTRIFRRVVDDVPAQVETAIELDVAGHPREITVPMALLPGFTALQLRGSLPMRLDGGNLRVQAVAGKSWLYVTGRQDHAIADLKLPAGAPPEIWSFQAVDQVRRVEVQGPVSVDPRQADVPQDWQSLPAWRVAAGQLLQLKERHRGDASQSRGRLTLARTLWLDEDGAGLTFRDQLSGEYAGPQGAGITPGAPWRLNMQAPYELGRAALNGQDQYLTRDATSGLAGLEVRGASLNLQADGRLTAPTASLPVSGWVGDLQGASAQLNVAPGWRLIHASGVEHAEDAWTARWTLWDLFLALLVCFAASRVFGWLTAAVLGAAFVLTWTVPGAPGWWWLVPVMGAAAQRAAGDFGRLQRLAGWIKRAGLLAVGIGVVTFSVGQLRSALHPALEQTGWRNERLLAEFEPQRQAQMAEAAGGLAGNEPVEPAPMQADALTKKSTRSRGNVSSLASPAPASLPALQAKVQRYESVDPAAKVQTGPGVPSWQWRSYRLSWAGPVKAEQTMRLWLAPPWLVRMGNVVSVILLLVALWLMAGRPRSLPPGLAAGSMRAGIPPTDTVVNTAVPVGLTAAGFLMSAVLAAALLAPAAPVQAQQSRAQATPTVAPPAPGTDGWQALMQQLRERLLEAPPCAPACAGVSRLTIGAHGETVELRLQVHAMAESVLVLPGGPAWRAARNEIDGHEGDFSDRGERQVAVRVPTGVHVVTRTLSAAGADEIAIALPQSPGVVDASLDGWSLSGLREDGTVEGPLNLVRVKRHDAAGSTAASGGDAGVAPFARIERTLSFASRWHVATSVQRLDGGSRPQTVQVPLLPGEAITAANIKVEGGMALLTLAPGGQAQFTSDLDIRSPVVLQSARRSDQFEVWNVEATTLWSVKTDGIAPVLRVRDGLWSPQWRPWPGESASLTVQRPEGVAGSTLTIDEAQVHAQPGERATDSSAMVLMRASLGGTHRLKLPAGATLLTLKKDGRQLQPYTEADSVPIQIEPGTHRIELTWRQERGIAARFEIPRLDLGSPAVNLTVTSSVPADRWLLLTWGPTTGPAVLFWSMLLVLVGLAVAGAKLVASPLSLPAWIVLAIGAGQAGLTPALIVLGFMVATAARERAGARLSGWKFDLAQIIYLVFAVAAVATLLAAVRNGLLGQPSMLVQGFGSSDQMLRWFQDRSSGLTPQAALISVPLWVWRLAMLAWSVWIALTIVRIARWVWIAFSAGGRWKKLGWGKAKPAPMPETPAA
jgi:hypothetical protein